MAVSDFETMFGDGPVDDLFDVMAESITYTPLGGAALSITAIVEHEPLDVRGPDGARIEGVRVVTVMRADVAEAKRGDSVTIPHKVGGTNISCRVTEILGQNGAAWRLALN